MYVYILHASKYFASIDITISILGKKSLYISVFSASIHIARICLTSSDFHTNNLCLYFTKFEVLPMKLFVIFEVRRNMFSKDS